MTGSWAAAWRRLGLSASGLAIAAMLFAPANVNAGEPACLSAPDLAIANGRFFSQTGSQSGLGYYVFDDGGANFWTAFQSAGGVPAIGYPISNRYHDGGFVYQAFQKAILQWSPEAENFNHVNTVDWLGRIADEDELFGRRQVPRAVPLLADYGLDPRNPDDYSHIVQNHLQLLAMDQQIRDFFLAEPRWLELYGLPISYHDFGSLRVMRTQRQLIQVWNVADIGGPVGVAVLANTGEMAKEYGLVPPSASLLNPPPAITGDQIIAQANPVRAGSIALATVHGTAAQVAAADQTWRSHCVGVFQRLLVPVPHDVIAEKVKFELNALGRGPALIGELTIDVEPLEITEIDITGLGQFLAPLFDVELETMENEILRSITSPINSKRLWETVWTAPLEGALTSFFGDIRHTPLRDEPLLHAGTDIAVRTGDPVAASASGVVVGTLELSIYGNTVVIDHGFGVYSIYAHLQEFSVAAGQEVSQGDVIGLAGSTGRSTGPHLHWEVRYQGQPVDTRQWTDIGVDVYGDDPGNLPPTDEETPPPVTAVG